MRRGVRAIRSPSQAASRRVAPHAPSRRLQGQQSHRLGERLPRRSLPLSSRRSRSVFAGSRFVQPKVEFQIQQQGFLNRIAVVVTDDEYAVAGVVSNALKIIDSPTLG